MGEGGERVDGDGAPQFEPQLRAHVAQHGRLESCIFQHNHVLRRGDLSERPGEGSSGAGHSVVPVRRGQAEMVCSLHCVEMRAAPEEVHDVQDGSRATSLHSFCFAVLDSPFTNSSPFI